MSKKSAPRLQFTDEERKLEGFDKSIKKVEKATKKADKAQNKIPKETRTVKKKIVDPKSGKVIVVKEKVVRYKAKLDTNTVHKMKSAPANALKSKLHHEISEHEDDNTALEGLHKLEQGTEHAANTANSAIRSQKLRPYRKSARAENHLAKTNNKALYKKSKLENPELHSNLKSRLQQRLAIRKQYAAARRSGQAVYTAGAKTAQASAGVGAKVLALISGYKKAIAGIIAGLFLLMIISGAVASCSMVMQGVFSGGAATTYPSTDEDMKEVDSYYSAKEAALQTQINNTPSSHPGYDNYIYNLSYIGHNGHDLASYLSAVYLSYDLDEVRDALQDILNMQYSLIYTESTEVLTRTPSSGVGTETYEQKVLTVTLTTQSIDDIANNTLTEDQLTLYNMYKMTLGNNPLLFGGGSPDTSASESLSGVQFVDGKRPGNQSVVDIALSQVGNVNGYPYWSWYGFNGRVPWCACFVSWCINKAGYLEPKFAHVIYGGISWFSAHGQWGSRGYPDIAPGDLIFFDWENNGETDHVGMVIGKDSTNVYTVEGNSGNACKVKSYPLNSPLISGYGLMNW